MLPLPRFSLWNDGYKQAHPTYLFFISSGEWGKIKVKLTTLSRIFIHARGAVGSSGLGPYDHPSPL